jgi:hypothetical protein
MKAAEGIIARTVLMAAAAEVVAVEEVAAEEAGTGAMATMNAEAFRSRSWIP